MSMHKMCRVGLVALSATLLFTACGKSGGGSDKSKGQTKASGATVNYEDYITPVVDRKVTDCITEQQISSKVGVPMQLDGSHTDSEATYLSEDASYQLTLLMENRTRAEFDEMVADPSQWILQVELGEVAFWSADRTQLVVYQNGYAVSVYMNVVDTGAVRQIMDIILSKLQ